ncbi:MAG: ferritin family protein [Deltaproteobacteria bacterium]|nr:ferritin family protein [Deltaproteobacteria bacterium]
MEFKSYQAIIDFAIEKEIEAASFYEEAAGNEAREETRKMFLEFAREERKHQHLLENLDCTGECNLVTRDYKFKWIGDLKRSDFMVDIAWQKGMSYRDILLLAMKREEKALKLYNELRLQAETETAKDIFKILRQEEARHKLGLEKLYDEYMAQMGD